VCVCVCVCVFVCVCVLFVRVLCASAVRVGVCGGSVCLGALKKKKKEKKNVLRNKQAYVV